MTHKRESCLPLGILQEIVDMRLKQETNEPSTEPNEQGAQVDKKLAAVQGDKGGAKTMNLKRIPRKARCNAQRVAQEHRRNKRASGSSLSCSVLQAIVETSLSETNSTIDFASDDIDSLSEDFASDDFDSLSEDYAEATMKPEEKKAREEIKIAANAAPKKPASPRQEDAHPKDPKSSGRAGCPQTKVKQPTPTLVGADPPLKRSSTVPIPTKVGAYRVPGIGASSHHERRPTPTTVTKPSPSTRGNVQSRRHSMACVRSLPDTIGPIGRDARGSGHRISKLEVLEELDLTEDMTEIEDSSEHPFPRSLPEAVPILASLVHREDTLKRLSERTVDDLERQVASQMAEMQQMRAELQDFREATVVAEAMTTLSPNKTTKQSQRVLKPFVSAMKAATSKMESVGNWCQKKTYK